MAKKTTTEGLVSILGDILSNDYLEKPAGKTTPPKTTVSPVKQMQKTKSTRSVNTKKITKKDTPAATRVSSNSCHSGSATAKTAPSQKQKSEAPALADSPTDPEVFENTPMTNLDVEEQPQPTIQQLFNQDLIETSIAVNNNTEGAKPETSIIHCYNQDSGTENYLNITSNNISQGEAKEPFNTSSAGIYHSKLPEAPWSAEQRKILEMVKNHQITSAKGYQLIAILLKKYHKNMPTSLQETSTMVTGYYQNMWQESKMNFHPNNTPVNYVVFFDTNGEAGDVLAESLKNKGVISRIIVVKAGASFRELGRDIYEINPAVKDEYRQLIQNLVNRNIILDKIVHWWSRDFYNSNEQTLNYQLESSIYSLLYLSQVLMEQKLGHQIKLYYIFTADGVQPQYAAVGGFVKSIRLENPNFDYKTIEIQIPAAESTGAVFYSEIAGIIAYELRFGGNEIEVRYQDKRRLIKYYQKIEIPHAHDNEVNPFKEKGVYIITGGTGGLGLIFAAHLARKFSAKLILVGRTDLTVEKQRKINELVSYGSEIIYIKADISRKFEVENLISLVKSRFHKIDGVIHSAGLYQNGLIIKKSKEDMEKVFASKVWGTIFLDEVLKDEKLDFLVLCSSLAGETGKVGQSDYAFGNCFLDNFSEMREELYQQKKRHGKTIAIDWPLWQAGGMTLSDEEREMLRKHAGMEALLTHEGLCCLDNAVKYGNGQLMVTYGDQHKIQSFMTQSLMLPEQEYIQETPNVLLDSQLFNQTEALLKDILANEIGLTVDKVNSSVSFEDYGIDSIVVNHFNTEIEAKLGSLPKTLLFEYHNLHELTDYLVKNQTSKLARFFSVTETEIIDITREQANDGWKTLTPIGFKRQTSNSKINYDQHRSVGIDEDIAIIGLSGHYPGAKNLYEFWSNLISGKDCITEIPANRWDYRKYYDSSFENVKEGKMYCKWGGFIEDFDKFEPLFFNISPREAEAMDPQERLFLETVWATLEDAGYNFKKLRKLAPKDNGLDVGVFVGVTTNTYSQVGMEEWAKGNMVTFGSSSWSIANRVSYVFNFQGPSMPVDTACSSALIAIHIACESLKKGECSMAIAGGVNLYLHPSKYVGMSQAKMLSPTGRCNSFGLEADGMVPGEGVGAILLKPFSRALADQDHIYAVIKGSAVNHGGKTNGYSVPNPNAQAGLILDALKKANMDPLTLSYIEAHGTGTALGDPIEISGLTKAVEQFTKKKQFCAIGSVKSNIGHLESAAGMAGLTKILLQMKYRQLVPSIHAESLNPNIDFENTPFYVQRKLAKWEEPVLGHEHEIKTFPRRAGISAFGAGGSNAHILLEEYQSFASQTPTVSEPQLIVLSAKNEARLKLYVRRFIDFLEEKKSEPIAELAANPSLIAVVAGEVHHALENNKIFPFKDNELYLEAFSHLERLGHDLLLRTFQKMGVFLNAGEQYTYGQLRDRLRITSDYYRIFEALIEILACGNFITMKDDIITTSTKIEDPNLQAELKNLENRKNQFIERYAEIEAYLNLLWVCVSSYPKVLTGQKNYTEVMFPGGSMDLVENIYRGSKIVDYFNELVGLVIVGYIRKCLAENPRLKIKILEIGAGTGGTSTFVLDMIKDYASHITYIYTDISIGFTQYGKRHFGSQYPFIEFKVLDIENSFEQQGFEPESVDLIFATNVIHATRQINGTLNQIKGMLKPNGLILINEITKKRDFTTLTFGLTTGWWLFGDKENRIKNSPFLSAADWKTMMENNGFQQINILGVPRSLPEDAGQHLIVGEKKETVKIVGVSGRLEVNLADLAFTLQVGREPMEERLAVVASNSETLIRSLTQFINGQSGTQDVYRGNIKRDKDNYPKPSGDHVNQLLQSKQLNELGQSWVQGAEVDWLRLSTGELPQIISLPTYPFDGQRYWLPQMEIKSDVNPRMSVSKLHPLIDQNVSTLEEQKFITVLTGAEFFTDDHQLDGRKVLPGVAYIEMALAAGNLSSNCQVKKIKNLIWAKPMILDETTEGTKPVQIGISLYPGQDEVKYQVWSGEGDQKRVLHVQGGLVYSDQAEEQELGDVIDLDAIKKRLPYSMDHQTCYQLFDNTGLRYGSRFRAIRNLYYNKAEVLSVLELPAEIALEFENFKLHPTLMDGALQSIIALKGTGADEVGRTYVPFELGEINIYHSLPRKCYAHIMMSAHQPGTDAVVRRYDIRIANEAGQVMVFLKDFSFRALERESFKEQSSQTEISERIYYRNQWEKVELGLDSAKKSTIWNVVVFDTNETLLLALQERLHDTGVEIFLVKPGKQYHNLGNHIYEIDPNTPSDYTRLISELRQVNLAPVNFIHRWSQAPFSSNPESLKSMFQLGFYSIFYLIQALLEQLSGHRIQFLYIYSSSLGLERSPNMIQPQYAALSGFVRTINAECSDLKCKTIEVCEVRGSKGPSYLAEMIIQELETGVTEETEIRYDDDGRWVKNIREITIEPVSPKSSPFKSEGVYLITGGAGGLGLTIAGLLAAQVKAKLILSGRSNLNFEQEGKIRELEALGTEVIYVKSDVSKHDDVRSLIATTKARFGYINGVIHCAGIIQDNSIVKKTQVELETVLAPKVFGTIFLDEALVDETLDFFVLFSSLASVIGNPGQSDYAFANGFMNQYAEMRANEARLGKVLAINWPLWENGGMKVNEATAAMLNNVIGMKPISAANGFKILLEGLSQPETVITVFEGDGAKIRRVFGKKAKPVKTASAVAGSRTTVINEDRLLQKIQSDLLVGVAKILKINIQDIDVEAELSEFGFDSVTFTQYSNLINEQFNLGIMPSIFFEYRSLDSFSRAVKAEYHQKFIAYYHDSFSTGTTFEESETMKTADMGKETHFITRTAGDGTRSKEIDEDLLLQKIQTDLLMGVAKILKINEQDIDVEAELSEFGFDSVTFTQYSNLINEQFNLGIMPSIFFEYRSLDSFSRAVKAEYHQKFIEYYHDSFSTLTLLEESEVLETITMRKKAYIPLRFQKNETTQVPVSVKQSTGEPVAIIGISGVMPQSEDIEEFWSNIEAEKDLITEIPIDRWDWKGWYGDPKERNKTNIKWGGFMKEADKFDAQFFGISPREAELMDPQQRIFLEVVWKTIEDAGYKATDLAGTKLGLFVGVASADYSDLLRESGVDIQAQTATGNFHSVLVNRISYLFDFHGPSEPVDTACSSSLVAIHRAVKAIQNGDCPGAIAGGINVIASPSTYITFSKAGMLCEDGRCKTFDQQANGYVRGEGAGAIFLKSLSMARADGDHIYGIIQGTAVNHGGHTNSLTAPNPIAQADLLIDAWRKSRIDPRQITYIEAHGTGTSLGDPIEINGLKKAFEQLYRDWNLNGPKEAYCGLGSVKTNIGHLEAASGIAGIIKVLVAMQHQKLPGNIHFKEMNPYIQLQGSPFYIVDQTQTWKRLKDETGQEIPRIAGVSSFGFGGVNAHIVIEESEVPIRKIDFQADPCYLIVISAKNAERLQAYIGKMLAFLDKKASSQDERLLENIAYTLQVGRQSMEERLALVVFNLDELKAKLMDFYSQQSVQGIYQGNIKVNHVKSETVFNGEAGKESVDSLLQRRELAEIAQLWVQGIDIDWKHLYRNSMPTRIALPTYPFAKDRYWLPIVEKAAAPQQNQVKLHALIDSNESTLDEQCYQKIFSGEEFFIKDHSNILPGVVYMEMLRVAGNLANRSAQIKKMKNIVWISPIAVIAGDPCRVSVGLYPDGNSVSFEVSTTGNGAQKVIHCQGKLVYESELTIPAQSESIDVEAVKSRCRGGKDEADSYYQKLDLLGIHFGPRFKGIQEFYYNCDEALSFVGIPPELEAESEDYILHPTLTDGGLQTVVVWAYKNGADADTIFLPFVLGEIEIIRPSSRVAYVYAKKAEGQESFEVTSLRYNVWLLDRQGRVVIKLTDYSVSALHSDSSKSLPEGAAITATIYAQSQWEDRRLEHLKSVNPQSFGNLLVFDIGNDVYNYLREMLTNDNRIILVKPGRSFRELKNDTFEINPESQDDYRRLMASLAQRNMVPRKILHLWSRELFNVRRDALKDQLDKSIYSLFYLSRLYSETQPSEVIKLFYVYFTAPDAKEGRYFIQPQYAAIGGFAKVIPMENPYLRIKTIELRTGPIVENRFGNDYLEMILHEFTLENPDEIELRYQDGNRFVKSLQEFSLKSMPQNQLPLRNQGVYLITGGVGGLGLIFAQYLAQKTHAKLVLTGRTTTLNPEKLAKIKELETAGAEIVYLSADLSSRSAVDELIAKVKLQFTEIHGVIHCAGEIRDSLVREKQKEDFEAVLVPKVYGTVNLDEATQTEPLDFFVLFSSVTAIIGNVGQSDYAYANSFMDSFATQRLEQNRPGKSLAINWPLWMNGGMQVNAQVKNMLTTLGIKPISNETGLNAFETGLLLPLPQFTFLEGDPSKIRHLLRLGHFDPFLESNQAAPLPRLNEDILLKIRQDIITIMAGILKYDEAKLNLDDNMSTFGFDSITLTELANNLNEKFRLDLTPALFFKHSSPGAVALCLFNEHYEQMLKYYDEKLSIIGKTPKMAIANPKILAGSGSRNQSRFKNFIQQHKQRNESDSDQLEEVAIIGMSGVMPQSKDLEEFWLHMENMKDLVTVIPKDRWNWESIYGEPSGQTYQTNIKWGSFINDVDKFDPLFFGIAPRDAELMDPQERIMIEVVWKTIEDAGYRTADLSGTKTGLFIGVSNADYQELLIKENKTPIVTHSLLTNRISYLLNIHGPSEPVDTACSSSLVAIHRAVEAIQLGNCELALAGGINIIVSPNLYIYESLSGMLSIDGRCKTFDKGANGYVRGEGAGAILLKPLSKALADGDHIYAVIKATSVNHGGHASSLTAPNAAAQTKLLVEAYQKARLDPSTISYIETHGTGTSLGDPVEIEALKDAFKELYQKWNLPIPQTPHCGLGAVKTNIGHLESASGIAGVLKVLLALKYKKLPSILHFKELNPYIKLESSPFYIVNRIKSWERLLDSHNQAIPRRAGISSFGIGGVNAHIILEEHENIHNFVQNFSDEQQIVVFSAKNKERLRDYIQGMIDYFQKNLQQVQKNRGSEEVTPESGLDLQNIAYTLQIGRESMEERLAIIASNLEELIQKLILYHQGKPDIDNLFYGNIKSVQTKIDLLVKGKGWEQYIQGRMNERDYVQLAKLWVVGIEFDWKVCYQQKFPQRVSLPTYPFARERYWLPGLTQAKNWMEQNRNNPVIKLHPCIDANTSTLWEQRFTTKFSGNEYFVRDHVIAKQKVLPGAVYIEMACAAVEIASEQRVKKLKDILWIKPMLTGDTPQLVDVCLYPVQDLVEFEFITQGNDGQKVVHAQGKAGYECSGSNQAKPEFFDVEAIKKRSRKSILNESDYQKLHQFGLKLGPGFQTMRIVFHNDTEALSYLELPEFLLEGLHDYILHPALIDGAFQTASQLTQGIEPGLSALYLPFSIEEMQITEALPSKCYAYVTSSKDQNSGNISLKKFNIKILDLDGQVVLTMKNYTVKELPHLAMEEPASKQSIMANGIENPKDETMLNLLRRIENGELKAEEVNRLLEVSNE